MPDKIEWPPKKLPANFALTPYKDGYCKHINGKWRHVCGKLAPKAAMVRYTARLQAGDFERRVVKIPAVPTLTVKGLANLYGNWLQERLDGKHRKKMSPRTFQDYKLSLQTFIDVRSDNLRLADVRVAELRPEDFAAFTTAIPGNSPYTRSRFVATIRAMFAWAAENGHIDRVPIYGSNFAKASKDELREARADLKKSFEPEEIRRILMALPRKSIWAPMILLALNGAFSNVELARLKRSQIDFERGIVQTMRGKRGRAMRKTLLWPVTLQALQDYIKPECDEAFADLMFVSRSGNPWVRTEITRNEHAQVTDAKRKDSLTSGFGRILQDALIPREGRSFSGLRTTFRTEAEGMPVPDSDAIDLICGHPRRHVSSEYVEKFPVHRLKAVTDFVMTQIFDGWSVPLTKQRSRSPTAPPPASESLPMRSPESGELAATG